MGGHLSEEWALGYGRLWDLRYIKAPGIVIRVYSPTRANNNVARDIPGVGGVERT